VSIWRAAFAAVCC